MQIHPNTSHPPPQVGGILTVCSASWGFSISLQHSSAVYCTSSLKLELHQCMHRQGMSMWGPRLVRAGLQQCFAVCHQEPASQSSSLVTLTTEPLPNSAFNKTELFHPRRQGGTQHKCSAGAARNSIQSKMGSDPIRWCAHSL